MDTIKKYAKYVVWTIVFYLFTMVCTYVGFNATYQDMDHIGTVPSQMAIDVAQATKVNGRIYGKVTSTQENDLNGKYIKVQIYTKKGNYAGTKYLKIENTQVGEPKKFAITFKAENIGHYKIEMLEDSEKVQEEVEKYTNLYQDVFTDEEMKMYMIVGLVLGLTYLF